MQRAAHREYDRVGQRGVVQLRTVTDHRARSRVVIGACVRTV